MSAQIDLMFRFKTSGVVVSTNLDSQVAGVFARMRMPASWPGAMQELDAIPTPRNAVALGYPEELRRHGITGRAVVEFYIDRDGNVRMPAVTSADHLELGILATGAVRQWRFEPPTRDGHRVLVKAGHIFSFRPSA